MNNITPIQIKSTWKELLAKLPAPLTFLGNTIREDMPHRVSALLAVIAGLTLCFGFVILSIAMVLGVENLITAFLAVNAALVTLSTLNKVDIDPSVTTAQTIVTGENSVNTSKEIIQK